MKTTEMSRIRDLLEKYYEGNTLKDEEEVLRSFFLSDRVPEDMEADRLLFLAMEEESSVKVPDGEQFDARFFRAVSEEKHSAGKPSRTVYLRFAAIAASFLIIAGSYFIMVQEKVMQESGAVQQVYVIEDPEKAYEEAKNALLYVSAALNRGTADLQKLSRFDDATKELSAITKFHDVVEKYGR